MAKEKKTLKFQMMMSPEEAETLDDWMFRNRIRSRAEAIRRLCQIGLLVSEEFNPITKNLAKSVGLMGIVEKQWDKLLERHSEDKDMGMYARRAAMLFGRAFSPMQDTTYAAHNRLNDLVDAFNVLMNAPTPSEGILDVKKINKEARERWERWAKEDAERYSYAKESFGKQFVESQNVNDAIKEAERVLDVGEQDND